jgi:hypothetical protein
MTRVSKSRSDSPLGRAQTVVAGPGRCPRRPEIESRGAVGLTEVVADLVDRAQLAGVGAAQLRGVMHRRLEEVGSRDLLLPGSPDCCRREGT